MKQCDLKNICRQILWSLAVVMLLAGCERDVELTETLSPATPVEGPDSFSAFLDLRYSLSAGDYTVVVATKNTAESASFTLSIVSTEGAVQEINSEWTASGGLDPASSDNPRYTFTLPQAGGVRIELNSTVDNYLYLLDRNGTVVAEDDDSGSDTNALIDLPENELQSAHYARQYYQAIDPADSRATLSGWKSVNGFDMGDDETITFRDTKDLGYGRRMHVRKNIDGSVAIYVENYQFAGIDGLEYGVLNLEALVNDDQRHHFGTNAIEFSPGPGGGEMFAKFYTFRANPLDPTADEIRIDTIDLDGRGAKAMPGPCIVCHGGKSAGLNADGSFPDGGNTFSRLQTLEPDTFDFSTQAGFSRADQEAAIKRINQIVLETYPMVQVAGEWDSSFAREMIEGWYGGTGLPNDSFDGSYVPVGWRPDPDTGMPPPEADELFLKVVKPSCLVCHSRRGTDLETDINFSSYSKFISYADAIETYVYEQGIMPLALLPYSRFWDSDSSLQPEILAASLPGFSHAESDFSIPPPGKPVANPGPARRVNGAITLTAEASAFASTYNWSVLSKPPTSTASLGSPQSVRTSFSADEDGEYVVQLIVSDNKQSSQPATITITQDSALPVTRDLTFTNDIKPIIQSTSDPVTACITCHTGDTAVVTAIPGIPVFYTDRAELYHDVRQRVNLRDFTKSRLLLKPTGYHHYGALQAGFDLSGNSDHYNTILNWIIEGAVE